jgi:hypothetical protein
MTQCVDLRQSLNRKSWFYLQASTVHFLSSHSASLTYREEHVSLHKCNYYNYNEDIPGQHSIVIDAVHIVVYPLVIAISSFARCGKFR